MGKTAIILGATGMDAATLTPFLLDKGYKVIGVKRRTSTNTTGRIIEYLDNPNYVLEEGDILDLSSMNSLVNKYKPDELYLLAAMSQVGVSFNQPAYTFMCDAVGPLNIFEAIRVFSPQTKVYFAGTSEEFGNNYTNDDTFFPVKKVQSLETPFSPCSPYAAAKCAAHYLAKVYRESYGLFISVGVLFNHEGELRSEEFVTRKITQWIGKYKNWHDNHLSITDKINFTEKEIIYTCGEKFPKLRLGNIDSFRDWSHSEDMVRGMWLILQQDKPDDFLLASGEAHTVREFLSVAFGHIGIKNWEDYVYIDPEFFRPNDVVYLCGKADKAEKILGWKPTIKFNELVTRMVEADIAKEN